MYEFPITKDNQLLIKIKHNKFFNELAQNKLAKKFYNITSYVYLHRCTKTDTSYGFSNSDFYFNLENIFDENYEQAYMYSAMNRSFNLGIRSIF